MTGIKVWAPAAQFRTLAALGLALGLVASLALTASAQPLQSSLAQTISNLTGENSDQLSPLTTEVTVTATLTFSGGLVAENDLSVFGLQATFPTTFAVQDGSISSNLGSQPVAVKVRDGLLEQAWDDFPSVADQNVYEITFVLETGDVLGSNAIETTALYRVGPGSEISRDTTTTVVYNGRPGGDLTNDRRVNLSDFTELSIGWATIYSLFDFTNLSINWNSDFLSE